MATVTMPTIPVRLLDLGDDELECIVGGIQALEQDVVFVALACRRFLAAVRPVIRERDDACRMALHLLPATTVKLCTHVEGMFLSAARMRYCATHARSLGVTQAMGLVRPSLSPDNLPTGSLWHLIKAAPHHTIMDFYWYERKGYGRRMRFDMGLLENRALVMFAATHGRMDILYTLERNVPNQLDEVLFAEGAEVEATYYCPHHPDFTGPCTCRKPAAGLYRQAAADLDVVLERSFYVGDKTSDVQVVSELGGRGILVRTGYGTDHEDRVSDAVWVVDDLEAAANRIVATVRR